MIEALLAQMPLVGAGAQILKDMKKQPLYFLAGTMVNVTIP
jgi:hypothetical protein